MSAVQFYLPYDIAIKPTNVGAPGARLYVYAPSTTTKRAVYASSALTTQLANPVTADGAGRFPPIYLDGALTYKIVINDKNGAPLYQRDPYIPGIAPDSASLQPYQDAAEAAALEALNAAASVADAAATSAKWLGATGDGVTDDHTALQAWLDLGGHLYLPADEYYSSDNLILRKSAVVEGAGYGFDSRIVDGSATLGYDNQPGSRIRFAAGKGFVIQPQTTVTDPAGVLTAIQEGAYGSTIRNLALIGAGTGATATGLYCRTQVILENVHAYKFQGKGFDISATLTVDTIGEYGNASASSINRCMAISNGSHGFHIRGADANVIKMDTCTAQGNGGWGFQDDGLLGNEYINCHAASNASGSFKATSAVAFHTYTGCYIEQDSGKLTALTTACTVSGGIMANVPNYPSASTAFVFNAGQANRKGLSGLNDFGAISVVAGVGRDPSVTAGGKIAAWFGSLNDAGATNGDAYRLKYEFDWTGIWSWNYRNTVTYMEFPSGQASFYSTLSRPMAVGFPQGIALGTMNSAPRMLPAASAAPTSGTYRAGDTVPNSAPSASGKWGWVCVSAGSPGTWKAFGAIDA